MRLVQDTLLFQVGFFTPQTYRAGLKLKPKNYQRAGLIYRIWDMSPISMQHSREINHQCAESMENPAG